MRRALDPWLGQPKWKQTAGRVTFVYRLESEGIPPVPLKLKVETNTREHVAVYGLTRVPFSVSSEWFDGACEIQSHELDKLLGTKLRALYQRKWGRDLFDLSHALTHASADPARIVHAFSAYMTHKDHRVTRAQFEENIARKLRDPVFRADISPLLAADVSWDLDAAAAVVLSRLVARLPGAQWKAPPERHR